MCVYGVHQLPGIDTLSGHGFAFLVYKASAKTTIHGFTECLICPRGILHRIASDQESHFKAKEVWQQAQAQEFTGFIIYPIILEQLA